MNSSSWNRILRDAAPLVTALLLMAGCARPTVSHNTIKLHSVQKDTTVWAQSDDGSVCGTVHPDTDLRKTSENIWVAYTSKDLMAYTHYFASESDAIRYVERWCKP
jgi:hypothetical protein